jgi:hypothetical protein
LVYGSGTVRDIGTELKNWTTMEKRNRDKRGENRRDIVEIGF